MTAEQLGATGLEPGRADARLTRRATIALAVVIVAVAVAIATALPMVNGPQPAVVPAPAAASGVPAAPPTGAAPAPALALPSVFGPVHPAGLPKPGGPGLRCPGALRGPCAY